MVTASLERRGSRLYLVGRFDDGHVERLSFGVGDVFANDHNTKQLTFKKDVKWKTK